MSKYIIKNIQNGLYFRDGAFVEKNKCYASIFDKQAADKVVKTMNNFFFHKICESIKVQ